MGYCGLIDLLKAAICAVNRPRGEPMKFKAGQKWRTRCGDIVSIKEVRTEAQLIYPILGFGELSWNIDGFYDEDDPDFCSDHDLVELVEEAPEPQVLYLNVYEWTSTGDKNKYTVFSHDCEDKARDGSEGDPCYLETHKIVVGEGFKL